MMARPRRLLASLSPLLSLTSPNPILDACLDPILDASLSIPFRPPSPRPSRPPVSDEDLLDVTGGRTCRTGAVVDRERCVAGERDAIVDRERRVVVVGCPAVGG